METLTVEAQPVIDIPETGVTNEIVRYEPPPAATQLTIPDTDIVETTWRVVDDAPATSGISRPQQDMLAPYGIGYTDWWKETDHTPVQALPEPKPYTLNQQLADEWQKEGWLFERPTNELSVGQQVDQAASAQPAAAVAARSKTALQPSAPAPSASTAPAYRNRTRVETPGLLETTVGLGMDGICRLFDWLFDLLTFGAFRSGNTAPHYTPAKRILFVTRLDFGETLGAYLVGEGLPLQVEGMEYRKANMPEYKFSISAHHLRWGLRLMRDYGCDVGYDTERELWEVLPL